MPLLQLHNENFVAFWPVIKRTIINTIRIPGEFKEEYSVNILKNLLSGFHQAWLVFDWEQGEKKLHAVLLTSINQHPLTEIKYLYINNIYGYRTLDEDFAREIISGFSEFAKSQGCKYLRCETNNKRVKELLSFTEMEEECTSFFKEIK